MPETKPFDKRNPSRLFTAPKGLHTGYRQIGDRRGTDPFRCRRLPYLHLQPALRESPVRQHIFPNCPGDWPVA
jgi:hypothetical protein